jgi:hypothetical protein
MARPLAGGDHDRDHSQGGHDQDAPGALGFVRSLVTSARAAEGPAQLASGPAAWRFRFSVVSGFDSIVCLGGNLDARETRGE